MNQAQRTKELSEAPITPLSRQMAQVFSRMEFRGLCLEMNLNPDEPPEINLTGQCLWLIQHLQNDGRLPELLTVLARERPHVDWQRPIVPTNQSLRHRQNVLHNIYTTWIEGFLHQSLSASIALELNLQHEPTAVARRTLYISGSPEIEVENVRTVFEDYGRALLILGDPGSGKTITLLQLAEALIGEAQQDPSQPIPVFLNLASWAHRRQPFMDWLIEEIFIQYQVARQLSQQWIEQNQLLYLLDGLDEVAEEARDACVAAINSFKASHPAEMVVCSRIKDYEKLHERLNLGTAVRLQPLTEEQILTYLSQEDANLTAVRETIPTDQTLNELIHSPLFLSIIMLAYRDLSREQIQSFASVEARQVHLFSTYVTEIFRRRQLLEDGRAPLNETRQSLTNLAVGLKNHGQSIFYLERLQASWLNPPASLFYTLLVGFICGAFAGAIWGVIDTLNGRSFGYSLLSGLLYTLIGGLSLAIGVGTGSKIKRPFPQITMSGLIGWLSFALLVVLATAVIRIIYLDQSAALGEWLVLGLFRGWNILLFGFLIAHKQEIENVERFVIAWPTRTVLAKTLPKGIAIGTVLGLIIGLILGTAISLVYNLTVRQDINPTAGLFLSFIWGGCFGVISALLGAVSGATLTFLNGFVQKQQLDQRLRPNEGTINNLKSTLTVLLLLAIPLSLILLLAYNLGGEPGTRGVLFVANLVLPFVLLYLGGLAFIQHVALRLFLRWQGILPHPLSEWLDEMTDLILLRRVGGGWVFIHRALLEYFANQSGQ